MLQKSRTGELRLHIPPVDSEPQLFIFIIIFLVKIYIFE